MTRLRWRLARWIAPVPIIADPSDGKDGAVVVVRKADTTMALRADTFRMRSRFNPSPLRDMVDVTEIPGGWGMTTTFAGTARRHRNERTLHR